MVGTFLSAILALLIALSPLIGPIDYSYRVVTALLFIAISIFFFALEILQSIQAWGSLSRAEQTTTPRLVELYYKDRKLHYLQGWFAFFVLASFGIAFELVMVAKLPPSIPIAIWIFFMGSSLDLLHYLNSHITNYFNPNAVVKLFAEKAKSSIRNDKESQLLEWIDALGELGHRGIEKSNLSLCTAILDEMPPIAKTFLDSSKSIGHINVDVKEKDNFDNVSYTLFFILQRLEFINDQALDKNYETVCSAMISCVGKIAVHASKCDLTLVTYPIHTIGKIAKEAQNQNMPEVGVKASLTLIEIARVIITEVDITYLEIKDAFLSLINNLEEITKNTFIKDKTINIKILIEPFRDLKILFSTDKAATHQDTPIILQNVDRVIGEYESLELIMKTIPPLPKISETPKD